MKSPVPKFKMNTLLPWSPSVSYELRFHPSSYHSKYATTILLPTGPLPISKVCNVSETTTKAYSNFYAIAAIFFLADRYL